ncbi:MAG TPA: PAS domain S-box protein [Chitinophagaceae bacterium]
MFSFFEHTPDLVCIAGKDGYFRKINSAVVQKLQYPLEQLMQQPIASFIHPDDREPTARRRKELLEGKALVNFENRYLTSQGETVWLHWTSLYFPEKEVVFAIAKDVTARKRKEKELEEEYRQAKGLATHFKTRLEKDRNYLAAELHEELAQIASAVRMDLGWLSSQSADFGPEVQHRLAHAVSATGLLINSLRKLSYSIGTGMLAEVGLYNTLQWLCDETALLLKVPCRLEGRGEEAQIPADLWVDLFRMAQEILGSLPGGEAVKDVRVALAQAKGRITLSVLVRAEGGEPAGFLRSLEATGLQAWVASIHGSLAVRKQKGGSLRVSVRVPDRLPPPGPLALAGIRAGH